MVRGTLEKAGGERGAARGETAEAGGWVGAVWRVQHEIPAGWPWAYSGRTVVSLRACC